MAEYSSSAAETQSILLSQLGPEATEALFAAIAANNGNSEGPETFDADINIVTDFAGGTIPDGTDIVFLGRDFAGPIGQEFANVAGIIVPGDGNAQIVLSGGVDRTITLGGGDDVVAITGGTSDTVFMGGPGSGNDNLDLGGGFDRVVINQSLSNFRSEVTSSGLKLVDLTTGEETIVANAEFVQFADGSVIINTNNSADATVAKLYTSVLGRSGEVSGAKFWFGSNDDPQVQLTNVADAFLRSDEFTDKFGAVDTLTSQQLVNTIYGTAFGREADASGFKFWVGALDSGTISKAEFVVLLTTSAELNAKVAGKVNVIPDFL